MNDKQNGLVRPLTAAIAASLAPATAALAQDQNQDQGQEGDRVLEEVIVTATFRAVSMQDLPQSIQAFGTEDIARNAFKDFNDVANALPSLTLIADTPGRYSVKFRGVSTGTGEYYTDSTAAIYIDETPVTFNSQQLFPEMVDIERIESLPGPQGTLFGSSSLAGTMRIITNKPDPTEVSGEAFAEYYGTKGGSGSWSVNGYVNIPLVKDTLALRLVAYSKLDGGWLDNVYGETFVQPDPKFSSPGNNAALVQDDWNEYKKTGGRAALRWDINEDWSTTLTAMAENSSFDGSAYRDPAVGDYQIALFHHEFRDDDWWDTSLTIEGDLGFATLVSSTTYLDRTITYEWENMIYEQWKDSFWGVYYGFVLYNSEYTYGWIFNDQTQDRFSQEIRLTSEGDSRFQWMIGGFYEKINDKWYYGAKNPDLMDTVMWYYANYWAYYYNYYGYDVQYPLAPTIVGYSERLDRSVEQTAVFGEVSYDLTDKWSATFGARWFQFKRDTLLQNQFPEGLPPWGTFDTDGVYIAKSKDSDTVYKLSTQYEWADGKMVYALYSEGFRIGGDNSQRAANTGQVPRTFSPDLAKNYEIGLKSRWLKDTLQLNVTLFRIDWENRQFNEGGVGGQWWLRGTVNAGSTRNEGIEIGFNWQATGSLSIEGNATFLDSESRTYYEFLDGTILKPGDPLPNAPEKSYWVAVDWTTPWRPFDGALWVRADYAYGDSWWNSTTNAIERNPEGLIPSWNNTNLQVGLNLPNDWTVTAFVRNLTDEERIFQRQNNTYATDWFGTTQYAFFESVQRPRSYGINIRKHFK